MLRGWTVVVVLDQLRYPESLPITARRAEIVDAIREHQVVIVAGETGSGKSTQLPKLCLEAGRGADGRLIGHTQPRRVAARTIAERIAEEIGTPLGTDVGYTVRFTDQVSASTVIKVMTDGILLAEIQRDRMLQRYDTLIIDEAHERSLNIDFILGYLKQLLPQRPDLKVIVTSATIDTERFARHFATDQVIEVTGRTFPVEVRYRPMDDADQVQAIVGAVDELTGEGNGDVLVFLSGEREIRDAADALHADDSLEVLPLYARLSSAEQHRIFERPSNQVKRRVVLATNVAETSLTVPGVRYVVDTGVARISRYSKRLKVQRLPIEAVSQASANQRAGRCGRVAPGICIRLYDEDDFAERPEFTEPEILRTNLASVILQMTNIGLGDVAAFPFLEPPDSASIRDGYLLLEELAAIDPVERNGRRRLTKLGRRLARLPIDPRLGRMVLESERHGCVREVLVIASGLSIQDPRERPVEKREQANEMHARFRVDGSDLLSMVALWDHLREKQRELSGNQFRRMCRNEFLNYLRVREWMDLFSQLRRVAGELGIRPATGHKVGQGGVHDSHPDLVHKSLLAGLLSHVGVRDRERRDYLGARQARFVIATGSVLTRRPPDWVMAAELVETNQIYARRVAGIKPQWAEQVGAHLVKRSYGEARWDERGGRAVVTESVTLYGLPLVTDRVIGYDRVDPAAARAWFITKAFVEGVAAAPWMQRHDFLARNAAFLRGVRRMADRLRRVEIVDDEMLFDFYDARVGRDVTSTQHFDRWWKDASRADSARLDLTEQAVAESLHLSGFSADFPDVWRQGDIELPLTYRYAPGEPLDGVTVHLPLSALNQVTDAGFDRNVPGLRDEIVETLVRSLPKALRRSLIPLAETLAATFDVLDRNASGADARPLVEVLAAALSEAAGVAVRPGDFDPSVLPDHLVLHIVVSDDEGEVHAVGTDLAAIKAQLAGAVRSSIAAAAPIEERRGIVDWDLGDLPHVVETSDRALDVRAYPALLDVGESVSLRVVTTPELQRRVMHGGVRRLLLLTAAPGRSAIERLVPNRDRLLATAALIDDCIAAAIDEVMRHHGSLPWTRADFDDLRAAVRREAPGLAGGALTRAVAVERAAAETTALLAKLHADALRLSVDDANAHLGRLVRPGFVLASGIDRLDDIERYVRAITYRLEHLAGGAERDRRRMQEVLPLERRYAQLVDSLGPGNAPAGLADLAWQLEEFRVATFAQPLVVKRPGQSPVSAKRITAALGAMLGAVNDTVELLQTLIRNRCVNDGSPESGEEVRNADVLENYIEGPGVAIERFEPTPGRVSIVGRIEGTDPDAPSLCLMGHTDVVPVNRAGWVEDPFGGEVLDTGNGPEVWGRGAVDMLNLTASMAVTFRDLARSGFRPSGDLIYFAVADEEAGSAHGARWMADHHPDAIRATYALTESGGLHSTSGGTTYVGMNVAEKGVAWRRLTVHGTPGHGSAPFRGDNALVKAAGVVQRLAEYRPAPRFHELWPNRVASLDIPDEFKDMLLDPAQIDDVLDNLPSVGAASHFHACTHTTFSPNLVEGNPSGNSRMKVNVIPDTVVVEVDIRTLPGEGPEEVDAHLRAALGDLADHVEVEAIMNDAASISRTDTPLWDSMQRAVNAPFPTATLSPQFIVGFTDARVYRDLGAIAYGAGLFSPSLDATEYGSRFHGHNERIDVESLSLTTQFFHDVVTDLLG